MISGRLVADVETIFACQFEIPKSSLCHGHRGFRSFSCSTDVPDSASSWFMEVSPVKWKKVS